MDWTNDLDFSFEKKLPSIISMIPWYYDWNIWLVVTGTWLNYDFPYLGNFIIPFDELIIFQRGRSTTSQIIMDDDWWLLMTIDEFWWLLILFGHSFFSRWWIIILLLWWLMILLMMLYGDYSGDFFQHLRYEALSTCPLQAKRRCTQGLRSCEGRRRELQGEVVKPMEIAGKSMVFTYGKLEKHSDLEFDWCLNFFKSLFCIVLLFFSLFFSPKTTWWNKRTTSCEQNGQGLSLQWPGVLPFGNLTKLSRITIVNR